MLAMEVTVFCLCLRPFSLQLEQRPALVLVRFHNTYRDPYHQPSSGVGKTLVFPIEGLDEIQTADGGWKFRVLGSDRDDELEIIDIPRNVDKARLVRAIYWSTGITSLTEKGLSFLTCRRKPRTVTMDIMLECFGPPWKQLTCDTYCWESEYLPSLYQAPRIDDGAEPLMPRRRSQPQRLDRMRIDLLQAQQTALQEATVSEPAVPAPVPPVEPAVPPVPPVEPAVSTGVLIQPCVQQYFQAYQSVCDQLDIDEATLIPKSGSHGTYMNGEARMGILTPDGFVTLLPRLGNVLDGRFTPRNCVVLQRPGGRLPGAGRERRRRQRQVQVRRLAGRLSGWMRRGRGLRGLRLHRRLRVLRVPPIFPLPNSIGYIFPLPNSIG
jgi:hypothetical protein